MKPRTRFSDVLLDLDETQHAGDVVWQARMPTAAAVQDGDVILQVPFKAGLNAPREPETALEDRIMPVRLRAYGDAVVRVSVDAGDGMPDDSGPMLELHETMNRVPLQLAEHADGWDVLDADGVRRATIKTSLPEPRPWRKGVGPADVNMLQLTLYPDGRVAVPFMTWDFFFPNRPEALPLGIVDHEGRPSKSVFALHAEANERFAGTGERFAKIDLAGRTLVLENEDATGVNNRKAYKNIPFYVSSRSYGVFMHTSSHVRLSLADLSTRSTQGVIEEPGLDLFILGGGSVERVLFNYRRLTGFPKPPPMWSFGTWMSRMTYYTAEEVEGVARKLRDLELPCDVLHLDTGWFESDWICTWEFGKWNFPDPAGFMKKMRELGYRISLWQKPGINVSNPLCEMAREKGYIGRVRTLDDAQRSEFSDQALGGHIDFTNPEAVEWYKGMLRKLFTLGASVIKADFGEEIPLDADYAGLPPEKLHNLYALLYQKAAYEATEETTGEGIIWARAGWAGCQRYPIHWGGDSAASWDGMAGCLRGGLHAGLSGFGYWSQDIGGFHGVPDFMCTWPTPELYTRWSQLGVFTPLFRYHGTSPREPYEYPETMDIVRKWLRLRYALIPYIVKESEKAAASGYPMMRALLLHHQDDPACWCIDDQFYFGEHILAAPFMQSGGTRDVYLPEGEWVDAWTGAVFKGGQSLRGITMPLEQMPFYVRRGARIAAYPEPILCSDDMDPAKVVDVVFDDTYTGLGTSVLGQVTGLA
jgi:alpha-D-xyloside xylohydrolase